MDEPIDLESRYAGPLTQSSEGSFDPVGGPVPPTDSFEDEREYVDEAAEYRFITTPYSSDAYRSRMPAGDVAGESSDGSQAPGLSFQLNGPGTVSSFAWNGQQSIVQDMKACVSRGDVAGAKELYDRISAVVAANSESLSGFVNMHGQQAGPVADQLAERSAYFLFGQYNQEKVMSPDGTETTIGQLLSNPEQFAEDRSSELKRAGFNDAAASLFMQDDPAAKTIMNDLVRSKTAMPNAAAIRDFANVYANNHKRISGIFGEGTEQFIREIVNQHRLSGSAVDTLDTLLDYSEAYKNKTGRSGHVLAREVFSGYKNLLAASFKGVEKFDSHGVAMPLQVTENQQRQFAAAFGPAVRETLKRLGPGADFDLSDPRFRKAFLETQDALAYVSSAASDMFAESRRAGHDINAAFGQYIADAVTGVPPKGDNIVSAITALRADLSSRLTGGHDSRRTAAEMTGRSTDYLTSVKQTTGFESSCAAADTIANDVHQVLVRTMLPYITQGKNWGAALSRPAIQRQLVTKVAQRVGRSFFGTGRDEVSSALAGAIVQRFTSGEQVCIEDIVADMAFSPVYDKMSSAAKRTLRSWHRGNIAEPLRFIEKKRELRDRLLSEGYNEAAANTVITRVSERAASDERNGRNAAAVWDTAIATGTYWEPVYARDDKGNITVDKKTKLPKMLSVRQAFGDRRDVSLLVDGLQYPPGFYQKHPDAWNALQRQLQGFHEQQLKLQAYKDKLDAQAEAN